MYKVGALQNWQGTHFVFVWEKDTLFSLCV